MSESSETKTARTTSEAEEYGYRKALGLRDKTGNTIHFSLLSATLALAFCEGRESALRDLSAPSRTTEARS